MECVDNQDIKLSFSIVAKARDFHKYNKQRQASDKTKSAYQKIAERLIFTEKCFPVDVAKTKSTYYVYKAAVSSYILDQISKTLPRLDAIRKSDFNVWQAEVKKLAQYIDFLDEVGVDIHKDRLREALDGSYESLWSKKSLNHTQKKSKSKRLKTLPKNWVARIIDLAIKSNSKHVDAISVLAACGCRPQELSLGVELSLNPDGSIKFLINGAKTRNGQYGQQWRSFSIASDSIEFQHLYGRLVENNGSLVVKADAGAVCDKVSYLSRRSMPQLREAATTYCFRHRFSASLHQLNLETSEIAQALGHCADQSQQHYSKAFRTSASGFKINYIESFQEVKCKNTFRANTKLIFKT